MSYTHIFFDWDNTLWDFKRNATEALHEVFTSFALHEFFGTFERFFAIYALRNSELWRGYAAGTVSKAHLCSERFEEPLRHCGVANAPVLAKKLNAAFLKATLSKTRLMPHARDVVCQLHRRYTISVVSNGFPEVQYTKIENSGLQPYISNVWLSEEIGAAKPNPRFFARALEQCGTTASQVLLVGDDFDTDIKGAQKAGIDAVFYNVQGVPVPNGILTVADLKELLALPCLAL